MSEPQTTKPVALEETSLFKNVREDMVQDLIDRFAERPLTGAEVVFKQGDPGDFLVVITSGQFDLIRNGATGEVHLAELGPGTILGHVSLVDGGPRSATLRAHDGGSVATLDRKTFSALWQDPSPDAVQLQMRVTQLVIEELRVANRKLAGLLDMPLAETPEAIQRLLGVTAHR